MTTAVHEVRRTVQRLSIDAGVQVWAHGRRLRDTSEPIDLEGTARVPMASLYKLPLAACWSDLVHDGVLDPLARVALESADRAPGPTGVSALLDPVQVSQRDLVRLTLALSDNAAAEHLLTTVGLDRLRSWLADHGLHDTTALRGTLASWEAVAAETGGGDAARAPERLASPEDDVHTSEYDPALASATTAAGMVEVLALLWAHPHHQHVRDSLQLQVFRHRIGSGFPHDDVRVHGKTGTLGRLRHEVAVVEFPDEYPVAVAVLTKSARAEIHQPRVDAAIGEIARAVVASLRRPID